MSIFMPMRDIMALDLMGNQVGTLGPSANVSFPLHGIFSVCTKSMFTSIKLHEIHM